MLYKAGFSEGTDANDTDLVARIARSFQSINDIHESPSDSFWNGIVAQKKELAGYLIANRLDDAARLLRDPASTTFFSGFEHLVLDFTLALKRGGEKAIGEQSAHLYSQLTRVAAAHGFARLANPEASATPQRLSTDELIDAIEASTRTTISFPNPFPGEFGLVSKRGVISYRAIQSLYQAILLKRFAAEFDAPSVIDFGGGLGRTAYYAHLFGFRDYTLIDLPTTGIAQAYFLGRTLGEETISLQGEPRRSINIRIPEWLPSAPKVDVVMNVDSLTEMSRATADRYVQWTKKNAKLLISINHEANAFTAHEVMRDAGITPARELYWLRDGYVAEVARLPRARWNDRGDPMAEQGWTRWLLNLVPAVRALLRDRDALAQLSEQTSARLPRAEESLRLAAAPAAHRFKGYDIPVDLMELTGGGPATFDIISQGHIDNLRRWIGIEPTHTVLEIGCGIGRDAIPLTEILSDGRYVGIDIIKRSIDWCTENIAKRHPNFGFYHYDVQDQLHNPGGTTHTTDIRIPLPDKSVDRIVVFSVFTHMFQPEIEHYLREFHRVLKPTGLVYATTFLFNDEILKKARETNLTPFDLRFEHEVNPNCRINTLSHPLGAVAYTVAAWDQMISSAGLRYAKPFLRGAWSGFYSDPQDGQDVAILAPV